MNFVNLKKSSYNLNLNFSFVNRARQQLGPRNLPPPPQGQRGRVATCPTGTRRRTSGSFLRFKKNHSLIIFLSNSHPNKLLGISTNQ